MSDGDYRDLADVFGPSEGEFAGIAQVFLAARGVQMTEPAAHAAGPGVLFWLGSHKPGWLADPRFRGVPLFISRASLKGMRTLPRAVTSWVADSGGFTELQLHGRWTVTPKAYVAELRRYRDEIGLMAWAAPQDWMCEPTMLEKTGKSVEQHQRLTVENFQTLRSLAPDLPIVPVLQGWTLWDYWRCEEAYDKAGVDLRAEAVVGVGTICRRQATRQAREILEALARDGLRLHGFGVKSSGLLAYAPFIVSADSLAWSYRARHLPPLPGHDRPGPGRRTGHATCANCPEFALKWRRDLLDKLADRVAKPPAANDAPLSVSRWAAPGSPLPAAQGGSLVPAEARPDPPFATIATATGPRRVTIIARLGDLVVRAIAAPDQDQGGSGALIVTHEPSGVGLARFLRRHHLLHAMVSPETLLEAIAFASGVNHTPELRAALERMVRVLPPFPNEDDVQRARYMHPEVFFAWESARAAYLTGSVERYQRRRHGGSHDAPARAWENEPT